MTLMICGLVDTVNKDISSPFYLEFSENTCFSSKKQSLQLPPFHYLKRLRLLNQLKRGQLWQTTMSRMMILLIRIFALIIQIKSCKPRKQTVVLGTEAICFTKAKRRAKGATHVGKRAEKSNCYKGYAFIYGSCTFLGKPAFKPGMEKVLLNLNNADDI
ncbi:hypothetical protein PsorP6_019023 [Peronosclerospora sorghi]|nr:hypothetical protein PsorP6_019023 [Peronosclerospora sorghi]